MFDEKEESLKLKLLEMLMEEMDGESASRLKKPVETEISLEIEPEMEGDEHEMMEGMGEESEEDKLRKRIGALRK